MLTRLKVVGFKNLRKIDIQFGLFTCIAGANGVGKSNLFDAITFLCDLASMPILKACSNVRGTHGRASEFESLFFHEKGEKELRMEFLAEMIVPNEVVDDFDRNVKPTATLLEYSLVLRLNTEATLGSSKDPIHIEREELRAKPSSEAQKFLSFNVGADLAKNKKLIFGPGPRTSPFIETDSKDLDITVLLRSDRSGGQPQKISARKSPQTILSGVNLSSHPTALAARREMQSWRMLQLEPSALRAPDDVFDDASLSPTGKHMPNTLFRLGRYSDIANRLADLIPGVTALDVDTDESRQQRTLLVKMSDGRSYPASSLSDGTLRFLVLAVLASDPDAKGLVCLEEPENGIHPLRIPEMLRLVKELSDADLSGEELAVQHSLRQVIINTHSPLVVAELLDDELLFAESLRLRGASFANFKPIGGTWRARAPNASDSGFITRGELHAYLSGMRARSRSSGPKHVVDHLLPIETLDLFRSA
ncbi:AAA family ATPase [Burkholderia gladioli]